jgi:uroporphyrinogen decarboxylase
MNAVERLAATIAGQPADRIPVFCNLLDQGAREVGLTAEDYFADGDQVAVAQLRLRERFGYDNVWSLFYVGREAELLGCKGIVYSADGPPNVGHLVMRSMADVDRVRVPRDVREHPAFVEPRRCLERLKREVGGRHPICAYLTSSMTLPALLLGMEKWVPALLGPPTPERAALLEKCHDFFVQEVRAYREGGADVILYANPFASTEVMPARFVAEVALPWVMRDVEAVGAEGLVFYGGGARVVPTLSQVLRRTGLGAFYLGPLDDLAEAKRHTGRALCCGVLNDIMLLRWTPEEVRREVARLLAAGMPGGHFLFGSLVMPLGISEANIHAMVDAACTLGSYPPTP